METITKAAKLRAQQSNIHQNAFNSDKYDSFIAGALAPETEAYYKAKYSHIVEDNKFSQMCMTPLEQVRIEVLELIARGSILMAVKVWREANPGMGLREAKDYIDSLRPPIKYF